MCATKCTRARTERRYRVAVRDSPLSLIEFPADDPPRARRFWAGLLGLELEARQAGEGEGWQTHAGVPAVGVHARGRGPGDSFSLPYFAVSDVADALERVEALGGSVVHPGDAWAICKDSEGSPFGRARESQGRSTLPSASVPGGGWQLRRSRDRTEPRELDRHALDGSETTGPGYSVSAARARAA
jgi:predicted enzyme related to lactoylglutathione lyase